MREQRGFNTSNTLSKVLFDYMIVVFFVIICTGIFTGHNLAIIFE